MLPNLVQPKIRRKLRRLRLSLYGHLAGEGLSGVLLALAALVLVTLAIDYGSHRVTHEHMTVAQRLIILAACLACVGVVAWRRLVRPLLVPMSEKDLALVVERRHPELADRLASAVEFSRAAGVASSASVSPAAIAGGASEVMILKMAEEANAAAAPLRFSAALRHDRLLRWVGLALAAWAALGAFALWRPDLARLWLARNVLLADAEWPRDTYLTVEGAPRLRAIRGGPLKVTVAADPAHTVPREVLFRMEFPSVGAVEETVGPASGEGPTYVKAFDAVAEPFRFTVTGGDDRTPPCEVVLVEPPELREVAFTIDCPAHTHRPRETVSGDQGVLTVPVGSWIAVSALATKDLSRAAIHLDGAEAGALEIRPAKADSGAAPPRRVVGRFKAVSRSTQPALALAFGLTDTEGITNPRGARYTILLVKDREPAVQATARGVSGQVCQRAMIPLTISAKDDYGVAGVDLEWEIAGISSKPMRLAVRKVDPDQRAVQVDHALDLERLSAGIEAGESLVKVGETLRLAAVAHDALPEPDGPNWGRSSILTFKVVAEQELMAALLQMQKAMREQFRQAMVMQSEAQARTEAAAAEAARGQVTAELARLAGESAKGQQQVAARVAAVKDRFAQILTEMNNNRIGAATDKQRLQDKVIAPMAEISGEPMTRLAADLRAIMDSKTAAAAALALDPAARTQEALRRRMDAILAEMVQLESAQELERWLKMIIDMSNRVKEKTEAERKAAEPRTPEAPKERSP